MSLCKKFNTLLRKSDNSLSIISYENNGVFIEHLSRDKKSISKKRITKEISSFSNSYFDIDKSDKVYGLLNEGGCLKYIKISGEDINKTTLIEYTGETKEILFPEIKILDKEIHIFFYEISFNDSCTLVHYYSSGGKWIRFVISKINTFMLTNYCVLWNDNHPSIIFLNKVCGVEEILITEFISKRKSWGRELVLTDSKKPKVYLSACKDNLNNLHLTYCENNNNKYYCTYSKISLDSNEYTILDNRYINRTTVCEFPHIIYINNILYIQWSEYDNIFTTYFDPYNQNFLAPFIALRDYPECYMYRSYNKDDCFINIIYMQKDSYNIIGTKNYI